MHAKAAVRAMRRLRPMVAHWLLSVKNELTSANEKLPSPKNAYPNNINNGTTTKINI